MRRGRGLGLSLTRVPSASVSPATRTDVRFVRASDAPGYARRACARRGGSAFGSATSGRKSGGGAARDSRRALVRWCRAVVPRQCRYSACASGGGIFKAKPWGNCAFVLDRTGKYAAPRRALALCATRRDATRRTC